MYKLLVRPLLFLLPPETVHHIITSIVKGAFRIPGIYSIVKRFYTIQNKKLHRELFGIQFQNPVGLSAGFDKNGEVFNAFSSFGFSHIEVGTVTPVGQPGNPKPRSFRIPKDKGLINRMGFNNHGVDKLADRLSRKRRRGLIIGGNIGKNTLTANDVAVNDYEFCFLKLYDKVDYFVVNVSCPNITDLHELQDQEGLERILSRLSSIRKEKSSYVPVLLKISPDLNNLQLDATLTIVDKYGIDGIVATNTTIQRDGLGTSDQRIKEIGKGGLSGQPLTERSLQVVKYINSKTEGKLPIIGVGGIMNVNDALNMLDAGASLVQIYTGFIYEGPGLVKRINKEILSRS